MSYGITSINSSGFTQITSDSEVFQVLQTGTKPINVQYVTLPNTLPSDCLVFGRPAGGGTTGVKLLGGRLEDFVVSGVRVLRLYMTYNVAYDYAVVQRCSEFTTPTSGYGISIFKSNGDLGFTSEVAMLRAVAARAVTITSTSGAFNNSWYQGAAGSIDEAYVMVGPYVRYRYEQYQSGGENFSKYTYRYARFDYTNHTMGTSAAYFGGDLQRGSASYVNSLNGQKTEIMGYIV